MASRATVTSACVHDAVQRAVDFLNTTDPVRRAAHNDEIRTAIWREAILEFAELTPRATLAQHDAAAETLAAGLTEPVHVNHADPAWDVLDSAPLAAAARGWDAAGVTACLVADIDAHTDREWWDRHGQLHQQITTTLGVESDDGACRRVDAVIRRCALGVEPQVLTNHEAWLRSPRRLYGLIDDVSYSPAEALGVLHRCDKGAHVAVESLRDVDALTSLLDEGGFRGFPKPLVLSEDARRQARTWLGSPQCQYAPDDVEVIARNLGVAGERAA